jgi:hypothetical protein
MQILGESAFRIITPFPELACPAVAPHPLRLFFFRA